LQCSITRIGALANRNVTEVLLYLELIIVFEILLKRWYRAGGRVFFRGVVVTCWRSLPAGLALALGALPAAAAVLTFDSPFGPAESYTESGLTITATPDSASWVEISEGNGGFGWNLPCCLSRTDEFDLTAGGVFGLSSIEVLHSDVGDPVIAEGFLNGSPVATVDIGSGFLGIFEFLGFGQVDRVRITATGALTDPTFDNLTFNGFSPIPLPPAGLLLMAGMAGMLLLRRGEGLTCTSCAEGSTD
jgi:hypothetical protein